MKTSNPLIVTRHNGAVAWLAASGIVGEVIAHATPEAVTGRTVYGVLPLHLAARAAEVWSVDLPNLPADLRGQDLTPEQMDAAGATLVGYVVRGVGATPEHTTDSDLRRAILALDWSGEEADYPNTTLWDALARLMALAQAPDRRMALAGRLLARAEARRAASAA